MRIRTVPERVPSRATVYKASPVQSRLIVARYAVGAAPSLVVAVHLLLRGELDLGRLRFALIALVRRHPMLRTNYVLDGDQVLAVVHEHEDRDVFSVSERSGLVGEASIHEHAVRVFEELSLNFLAPDRHSILQAVAIPHVPNLHSLIIAIDHVALDERSRIIVQRDLAALYDGRTDDLHAAQPFDPVGIRNSFPRIEQMPELLDLLTPPPSRILAELPSTGSGDGLRPLISSRVLDPATRSRLDLVARQLRCTRFVLHLAAVMWALKQFSNCDDVSLAVPIDTRQRSEDFRAVGIYQNLAFLRSRSPRSDGLHRTVTECRSIMRDTLKRRDYPIASLIAHAASQRQGEKCRNPLYQIALIHSDEDSGQGWKLEGIDVTPIEIERSEAANELRIHVTELPERTEMLLIGAACSFKQSDLDQLLALWNEAETELSLFASDDF